MNTKEAAARTEREKFHEADPQYHFWSGVILALEFASLDTLPMEYLKEFAARPRLA